MAIIIVIIPKKPFTSAPAPIVKKWWSHTTKESTVIAIVAPTIEVYPKSLFWEKVDTTSEKTPKAGKTRIYTSGCPHIQIRLTYIIILPPNDDVKKCMAPKRSRKRSPSVAVKTGKAATTSIILASAVHTKIGIFIRVIPGARFFNIVTIKFIPERRVPIPAICRLQI